MLSWSGPRSKAMAAALSKWLPFVIQSVDPWMSDSGYRYWSRWGRVWIEYWRKPTLYSLSDTWKYVIHLDPLWSRSAIEVCGQVPRMPYLLGLQPNRYWRAVSKLSASNGKQRGYVETCKDNQIVPYLIDSYLMCKYPEVSKCSGQTWKLI